VPDRPRARFSAGSALSLACAPPLVPTLTWPAWIEGLCLDLDGGNGFAEWPVSAPCPPLALNYTGRRKV
jgi:hypothetical protein